MRRGGLKQRGGRRQKHVLGWNRRDLRAGICTLRMRGTCRREFWIDPKFFLDRSKNCSGTCQKSAWRSVWRLSKVSLRIRSMQTFPSCIVTFCMTAPLSLLVRLCDISVRMHLFFQTLHVSGFMPNYGESKAQGMFCIVSQREIRRAKRELPHTTVL